MAIRKRSKSRERFLDKMFNARQSFKNKFNYYEKHPWESRIYRTTLIAYGIHRWNFQSIRKFRRIWRKKMDVMFDLETLAYKRQLLGEMIQQEEQRERERHRQELQRRPRLRPRRRRSELRRTRQSADPVARLLINYDREVIAMIREINREFNHYLEYPHRYPYIHTEKKKFLQQLLITNDEEYMDIDVDFNDRAFKDYWKNRAGILCDEKVKFEKNLLRSKWRFAVRNHLRLSRDPKVEDLRCLLESDGDSSDVEVVDDHLSIIVISSDED